MRLGGIKSKASVRGGRGLQAGGSVGEVVRAGVGIELTFDEKVASNQ